MVGPFTLAEIMGAIVTCVLVTLTYRWSEAQVRNHRSVFVATTCVVLTLLLSIRYQLLPVIQQDLELKALAENSSDANQLFQMLAKAPTGNERPFMAYIVQSRMQSLNEYFDGLAKGRFSVRPEDLSQFLIPMLQSARNEIVATSYAEPASWWREPWGKSYEGENEAAIKRGVKVTRVFLFTSQQDLDAIRPLLLQEVNAGIKVKYAFVGNVPTDLVNGMVVIDDNLAGKLLLTPQRTVDEADFFTQSDDIEQIRRTIDQVELQAVDIQQPAGKQGGSE